MTQVVAKKNNGNTEFMDNLLMFHFEYTSLKNSQYDTFTRSAQVKDEL